MLLQVEDMASDSRGSVVDGWCDSWSIRRQNDAVVDGRIVVGE